MTRSLTPARYSVQIGWTRSINFFFSSRRRHTRWPRDWSSDVCSSDLLDRRTQADQPGARDADPALLRCGRDGVDRDHAPPEALHDLVDGARRESPLAGADRPARARRAEHVVGPLERVGRSYTRAPGGCSPVARIGPRRAAPYARAITRAARAPPWPAAEPGAPGAHRDGRDLADSSGDSVRSGSHSSPGAPCRARSRVTGGRRGTAPLGRPPDFLPPPTPSPSTAGRYSPAS